MNLNTPGPNDFAKPVHPPALIPTDWDFGFVIKPAQDDVPGKDSRSFLRFYDRAVRDWLQMTAPMNGKKIPVVKATPRNAFAEYDRLLRESGVLPANSISTTQEIKKHPLPLISLSRSGMQLRNWGFNPYPRRNLAFLNGANDGGSNLRRATVYTRNPTPVNIPYHIDVWTTYEAQHAWIGQMLLSSFWHKTAYWHTEDPYSGEKTFLVPMHLTAFTDSSDLAPQDSDANRRWTIDLMVEGWLFHDLLLAPTVQIAVKEIVEEGTTEVLATQNEVLTSLAPVPLSEQANDGVGPDNFVDDIADSSSSDSSASSESSSSSSESSASSESSSSSSASSASSASSESSSSSSSSSESSASSESSSSSSSSSESSSSSSGANVWDDLDIWSDAGAWAD